MSSTYFVDTLYVINTTRMTHLKEKYPGRLCGPPNFLVSGYRILSWR